VSQLVATLIGGLAGIGTSIMRKLMVFIHSTLNGVVTGDPSGDKTDFGVWTREANVIDEGSANLLALFDTIDTILLGRCTYEDLVRKWPPMKDAPGLGDVSRRLADKINNTAKFVVTNDDRHGELTWGEFPAPERLTGNEVVEQIRDLKNGAGGAIIIFGSPTLVRSLADAALIDEYRLVVHPVVVTVGEHLFDGVDKGQDLHLAEVTTFREGAILLTYKSYKAAETSTPDRQP
jgi:dihydrofolate reductase